MENEAAAASAPVRGERLVFSKYDGGKCVLSEATFDELTPDFVRVSHTDESGSKHTCRFRRAPGAKCGWGVGPSRFWRLSDEARKRFCHRDVPTGRGR